MPRQPALHVIAIVDDDDLVRCALRGLLVEAGYNARVFASAEEFLESGQQYVAACLIAWPGAAAPGCG